MEPGNESHLVHVDAPSTPKTETDADIAPLIQKVGATSIAEIEIPDLLRPDPPASTGETLRPPMPVGTASPEIK